jgi:hypothetical protein
MSELDSGIALFQIAGRDETVSQLFGFADK